MSKYTFENCQIGNVTLNNVDKDKYIQALINNGFSKDNAELAYKVLLETIKNK